MEAATDWGSASLGALGDPEMLAAALAVLEGDSLLPLDLVDDSYERGLLAVDRPRASDLALTGAFADEVGVVSEDDSANDGDRSSSTNSTSSSNSETDSAALVAKPKRRTRFRPKEELTLLRRQEHELAAKLRELRLSVVEASSRGGGGAGGRWNSLLFWERAAARQFSHRQRSEQENRRLKSLLQTQIRQARLLQQAINRRLAEPKQPDMAVSLPRRVPVDNTPVFHSILSFVDQLYTKLDAFCESVQAKDVYEDGTWSDPSESDVDKSIPFGWHGASTAVPFSVPQVQRAAWLSRGATESRTNPNFHRNFVQYSGDILLSSASTLVPQAQMPIYLQSQAVARMFVERGRSVFISRALVVPKDLRSGETLGVKFEETSVYVLTPADGPDATAIELHATIARKIDPGPRAAYWKQLRPLQEARLRWLKALETRSDLIEELLAAA